MIETLYQNLISHKTLLNPVQKNVHLPQFVVIFHQYYNSNIVLKDFSKLLWEPNTEDEIPSGLCLSPEHLLPLFLNMFSILLIQEGQVVTSLKSHIICSGFSLL